jgi:hypothetical protein
VRERAVAVRHDEAQGGLTFAEARASGRCQRCGGGGARVCGYRFAEPAADREPWWLAVACPRCIGRERGRGLRLLVLAGSPSEQP